MSTTFDESKHAREGDGKFAPKDHEEAGIDLDGGFLDLPDHVPAWDDLDDVLGEKLHEIVGQGYNGNLSGTAASVFDHLGISQTEAESAYGTDRARWIGSIAIEPATDDDYEGSGLTRIHCIYIDPVSAVETEISQPLWTEEDGLAENPDITDNCPFDENGDTPTGMVHVAQFTDQGREQMLPWNEAGIITGHVRGWQRRSIGPGEASRWQDAGYTPAEAEVAKRDHLTPEGAVAYSKYLATKREEKSVLQRLRAAKPDAENATSLRNEHDELVARSLADHVDYLFQRKGKGDQK